MRASSQRLELSLNHNELVSAKEASLFRALLYFEIFNFPLTFKELWTYSSFNSKPEFKECLNRWVCDGFIVLEDGYYLLTSEGKEVAARQEGEERAKAMWEKACSRAKLIQRFPFVRAVFISGSISKGVVAPDGDVDFFIITKPGRLWLSRTILALFKKVFLLGSHRYFCINYFIDYDFLEIEEQNQFTATEMATLIPMTGNSDLVSHFFNQNEWVNAYYPNFEMKTPLFEIKVENGFKRFLEKTLDILGASLWDNAGRWLTTSFWKMKFNEMPKEDFQVALKSNKHVSKHHPLQFQKRVLKSLNEKIAQFENTNGLKLES